MTRWSQGQVASSVLRRGRPGFGLVQGAEQALGLLPLRIGTRLRLRQGRNEGIGARCLLGQALSLLALGRRHQAGAGLRRLLGRAQGAEQARGTAALALGPMREQRPSRGCGQPRP